MRHWAADPDRQLIVKWAGQDALVLDMHGPARYITRGGEPIAGFAPDVHDALMAQATLGSDASGESAPVRDRCAIGAEWTQNTLEYEPIHRA